MDILLSKKIKLKKVKKKHHGAKTVSKEISIQVNIFIDFNFPILILNIYLFIRVGYFSKAY